MTAFNRTTAHRSDMRVGIHTGQVTAVVMMRILQAGIDPRQIVALIYQHYDPDLCGSMASFIDMCDHPDLRVISEEDNNIFISYYIPRKHEHLIHSIQRYDRCFRLGRRELRFVPTPYCHSAGSFATYDADTRTLFSSDLFGSFNAGNRLFLSLAAACHTCTDCDPCPEHYPVCPLRAFARFHEKVMPCKKAVRYALDRIAALDIEQIAPQHGFILTRQEDIQRIHHYIAGLETVGIDGIC